MSYMFEVYYKAPRNAEKERALTERIASLGGQLGYCEEPAENGMTSVCLTFEFDSLQKAEAAAEDLRRQGEHVEGPVDYGG